MTPYRRLVLVLAALFASAPVSYADPSPSDRYFISGDGTIRMENLRSGDKATIRYRDVAGAYPATAQARIDRLFGIPADAPDHISLRLVSLLDYIEDRYRIPIRINSGYRSPAYNGQLRAKGRLAAKASLHMEGMASDLIVGKGLAPKAFEDIRAMDCCGVGYYHGESLHLDTGPARFWDETSSKVDTDISSHNKLLMARTDRDIYLPGEHIALRIARITDYPVSVSATVGVERAGVRMASAPIVGAKGECTEISEPIERDLNLTVPDGLPAGARLHLRVDLCDKPFPEMPDRIFSNDIQVWGQSGRAPDT